MNIAYIDGQNLHLGVSAQKRQIDFEKLRVYLRDKFGVKEAYYYLWFVIEEQRELYLKLQKAGFIVMFREYTAALKWKKKGNVDSDIIFDILTRMYEKKDFKKIILVSGDWDYSKLVMHLIRHNILWKILFPNNKYSSLYKPIKDKYWMILSAPEIQKKIWYEQPSPLPTT